MSRVELEQLARRREPLFGQVEDFQVHAGQAPERVLADIVAALRRLD